MGLYKKEVLVRPNSTANFETAMNWTRDWLNKTFQEVAENKDKNGDYKDYFFADVFFSYGHSTNSGQTWRIFSDACKDKYALKPADSGRIEFILNDKENTDKAIKAIDNKVADHENRLTTLENTADDGVEAAVI